MNLKGNTILITGGGSGIGRGLAEAFYKLGNHVIIAGRRREALDETKASNPAMVSFVLDIQDAAAIKRFAEQVITQHPSLNIVINNSGIAPVENLKEPSADFGKVDAIITTNLMGPLRLTAALLPHLQKQLTAAVINVSSGLSFVPLAICPTYCATKAAIHSYTESLRKQMEGTSVEVLEIIPPQVQTDLMGPVAGDEPRPGMPLKDFISQIVDLFQTQPVPVELCVAEVKMLRDAEANGQYTTVFNLLNGTNY